MIGHSGRTCTPFIIQNAKSARGVAGSNRCNIRRDATVELPLAREVGQTPFTILDSSVAIILRADVADISSTLQLGANRVLRRAVRRSQFSKALVVCGRPCRVSEVPCKQPCEHRLVSAGRT